MLPHSPSSNCNVMIRNTEYTCISTYCYKIYTNSKIAIATYWFQKKKSCSWIIFIAHALSRYYQHVLQDSLWHAILGLDYDWVRDTVYWSEETAAKIFYWNVSSDRVINTGEITAPGLGIPKALKIDPFKM